MTNLHFHTNGEPLIGNKDMLKWFLQQMEHQTRNQKSEPPLPETKICIYRVPPNLKENDKKCYLPQIVSLGPYHHGKKNLVPMELYKVRAVNMIINRTRKDFKIYFDAMKELEPKARACYRGPIALSPSEFAKMLLLDGCFVLELLRGTVVGFQEIGYEHDDPVFAMRGSMHSIQRDMLLLENQLPMFVLDRLFELEMDRPSSGLVAMVAMKFFDPLMPTGVALIQPNQSEIKDWLKECLKTLGNKGDLHCLDAFRRRILEYNKASNPKPYQKMNSSDHDTLPLNMMEKRQQQLIHCVTELREAGVRFKTREAHEFWDIRFKNGCLEIPKLLIHDGTKPVFSNLIAYEQCHIDSTNHMTSYIIFMDNLINSSEDVRYLHHHGIIEHWLGSDAEVAEFFNRLCQEVFYDPKDSYLSEVSFNVNQYSRRRWNAWKATLNHKYFSNPWGYFSFFAAVILLTLTLFQSFYAVYAYYRPPS